ncbi:hypothetical protein P3T23_009499, partial [Paraburkholderia sp. GAS448]
ACQLMHPTRWSSHRHLLSQGCCDDRLNPPYERQYECPGRCLGGCATEGASYGRYRLYSRPLSKTREAKLQPERTFAMHGHCRQPLGGVLGVLELAGSKLVGALTLLPGVIAVCATSLKLQTKANQYYRRKDALQFLHNYLTYDCPIPCTQEAITAVTAAWKELPERANEEFEAMAAPDWANIFAHVPREEANQRPKGRGGRK